MIHYRDDIIEIINGNSNLTPIGTRWLVTKVWSNGDMCTFGYNAYVQSHQATLYKRPLKNWIKHYWKIIYNKIFYA